MRHPDRDSTLLAPLLAQLASADRAEQHEAYHQLDELFFDETEVDEDVTRRLAAIASTSTHRCAAALQLLCELIWLDDDLRMFARHIDVGGQLSWERSTSRRVREVLSLHGDRLADGDEEDRKVVAYAIGISLERVKEPRGLLARLAADPSPAVRDTAHVARAARAASRSAHVRS